MKAARIVGRLRSSHSLEAVSRFFGIKEVYVIYAEKMTKKPYGELRFYCPNWAVRQILTTDIMKADISGMRW